MSEISELIILGKQAFDDAKPELAGEHFG